MPSPTRELPISFVVAGVQKAATSSIYFYLGRHRNVARGVKERHFFDDEHRSWDPPDYTGYTCTAERWQHLAGEATPVYLFWPRALERMRAYDPQLRLIVSFRDPIERAFSQWSMEVARFEEIPDFATAVADDTYSSTPDEVPEGMFPRFFRRKTLIARGFYGAQLQRGLSLFPRDQWLFLDFAEVIGDRDSMLAKLTDFLDLSPYRNTPRAGVFNRSPADLDGPAPTGAMFARLAERYAPDLELFERLSGIDTAGWSTRKILDGTLDPAELAERLGRKAGLIR